MIYKQSIITSPVSCSFCTLSVIFLLFKCLLHRALDLYRSHKAYWTALSLLDVSHRSASAFLGIQCEGAVKLPCEAFKLRSCLSTAILLQEDSITDPLYNNSLTITPGSNHLLIQQDSCFLDNTSCCSHLI